ncbi:hypothetical protein [Paraglaciecola chathamensis]|uniref:hypothetical protein n=1 Tax=Paraglaciecola chathamensis TaxID=368405 RepID=UPI0036344823
MKLFKKRGKEPEAVGLRKVRGMTINDETPNIAGIDFNVRNEVAESIATYVGAYTVTAGQLSKIGNNTAFIRRLVRHALKHERTYIFKSPTYGWLMASNALIQGNNMVITFTLPEPFNQSVTMSMPFHKVGVIESTMVDVSTEQSDQLLEEAFNAVMKKLRNTGAIKAFITSDVDVGLSKMAEDAEDKIKLMLDAASKLSGYTFLERGDEVTQMMPDYTTSNMSDFQNLKTFSAAQLSVSDKILDGSATDGEKTAVMFRFVEPILQQFKEYEPSLEFDMRPEFLVAFATTGGLLNSNKVEGWGKRLETQEQPQKGSEVEKIDAED